MLGKVFIVIIYIAIKINISNCTLKLIQTLTRHGARYPLESQYSYLYYPNDPHINKTWEPDGPMELTLEGKKESYELGLFLQRRYGEFLGKTYDPRLVYFHSVRMSRTLMTAQLIALSLYSPSPEQIWHPRIPLIPIPIHSENVFQDKLNFAMGFCSNYRQDKKISQQNAKQILEIIDEINYLFRYLSNHTGVNHISTIQGWMLYHQLTSQKGLNLTLEPWAEKILNDGSLLQLSGIEYILQTYTDRMKRIVGGTWIKTFLDNVDNIINHNKITKAFFYVTNELQITGLLNSLGIYKAPHVPSYCSTIMLEYHLINEKHFVKIVYKDKDKVSELKIKDCDILCPLETFKNLLYNVTLRNFDEDCGKRIDFAII